MILSFRTATVGIVSKRRGSLPFRQLATLGLISKKPNCEAVRREAEEDWGAEPFG
jgi:hypothetical protein